MAGQESEMRETVRPNAEVPEGLSQDGEPAESEVAAGFEAEEDVFGCAANEEEDREIADDLLQD